jgi:predicted dehydrogenase
VRSVATGKPMWPTFRDGMEIMRVVDACLDSSSRQKWVDV